MMFVCRAGRYDGIIVIPRYVNSPILILRLFVLYDFIVIDIIIAIYSLAEPDPWCVSRGLVCLIESTCEAGM